MYRFSVFLECDGDLDSLKITVDNLPGYKDYVELVMLFRVKRYMVQPKILRYVDDMSTCCFFGIEDLHVMREVEAYIKNSENNVLFFAREGDLFDPYCFRYIDSFFKVNHEICGVVFIPALDGARRELPKLFRNLPDRGLFLLDESLPEGIRGAAVWSAYIHNIESNNEFGYTAFGNMLQHVAKQKGLYGRINQVTLRNRAWEIVNHSESDKYYLVSCIIPIYKAEKYLAEAIDSVIAQTIGFEENVQLILINDGSPDNCWKICDEYQQKYPYNIVYIKQENAGVSVARNNGMDFVSGKCSYIFFLDADDTIDSNVFEEGIKLFDEYGEQVDFVSFPINFSGKKSGRTHPLEHRFSKAGLIDVSDTSETFNYIEQRVSSLLFRATELEDIRFDTDMHYAEDSYFVNQVLRRKQKYVVHDTACYNYRKAPEGTSALDNMLSEVNWYNKLFLLDSRLIDEEIVLYGKPSRYTQYLCMYDMQWYKIEDIPENIQAKIDVDTMMTEIIRLLKYIDDDIIKSQKHLSYWQKFYLRRLKYGEPQLIQKDYAPLAYYWDDKQCESVHPVCYIACFEEYSGVITISGCFNFAVDEHVAITAFYNNNFYDGLRIDADYKASYFLGRICQKQYVFEINIPFAYEGDIELYIRVDGFGLFPVRCGYTYNCRMRGKTGAFVLGDDCLIFRTETQNKYHAVPLSLSNLKAAASNYTTKSFSAKRFADDREIINRYFLLYPYLSKKQVWLFMDREGKADDNAEHLFRYCAGFDDGVEKYFVLREDSSDYDRVSKLGKIIPFGSQEHKLYALFAEKYIASNFDFPFIFPFGLDEQIELFQGLCKAKFVFLQHGITQNDMSGMLSRWQKNIKMFVTATKIERQSVDSENYGYKGRNIAKLTGMPRYDALCNNAEKVVTFLFTWRRDLAIGGTKREYNPQFCHSVYFQQLNCFFNDTRLIEVAEQCGYRLKFRPHPGVYVQLEDFNIPNAVEVVTIETSYQDMF